MAEDPSSAKDHEEDFTREIEIEKAYTTFEQAIALHKKKQYADAYSKYKELMKKEVIYTHYYEEPDLIRGLQNGGLNTHPDELALLSQNVKTIRFLFFRNRAFLFFELFKAGETVLREVYIRDQQISENADITYEQFLEEIFYCMIEDLSNCFIYQEPDESHLRLIHDIFAYLGLTRLAKFTLEYGLTFQKESDGIAGLLPINTWAQDEWPSCEERGFQADSSLLQKFRFFDQLKESFENLVRRKYAKNTLNVSIKALSSWLDVIVAFNQAIRQSQDKERQQELSKNNHLLKYLDPYLATENSLDRVLFFFPSADEMAELDNATVADLEHLQEKPTPNENPEPEENPKGEDTVAQAEPIVVEDAPAAAPQPAATASAERVVQRSSRRLNPGDTVVPFELDDIQLSRQHYFETEAFLSHLNNLFKKAFHTEDTILHDVVRHIVDAELNTTSPVFFMDFLKVLNEWKPAVHTKLLRSERQSGSKKDSKSDTDKIKLLHVLTHFGNQNETPADAVVEQLDDREDCDYIKKFLLGKSSNLHAKLMKMEILNHLLGGEQPLILTTVWSSSLMTGVKDWVMQVEGDTLNRWSVFLQPQDDELIAKIQFSIGIFEILIDSYATLKNQVDSWLSQDSKGTLSKHMKTNLNSGLLELVHLNQRIKKWSDFFKSDIMQSVARVSRQQHLTIYARYLWAFNYLIASQSFNWKEKKLVVIQLEELARLLEKFPDEHILVRYPNFDSFGNLDNDGIRRRLTTASILSIFSKILWSNSSKADGSGDTISLLENILIDKDSGADGNNIPLENPQAENSLITSVIHGRANLDKSSLSSVREFLDQCPIDLKLSLWSILFLYYKERGSFEDFQRGFEQNLKFMLTFLNSDKYQDTNTTRESGLLNSLSFFGSHLRTFLAYLADHDWKLPIRDRANSLETLKNVSTMFELFYTFSLHEEAALITGAKISVELKSPQAFQRFKDFCIECVTIMLVYCTNQMGEDEELTKDLLISVHSQLGLRRLCDSSQGVFLKFAEDKLVVLRERPDRELSQLLSCRFHYKVKIKDQFPVDHGTQCSADLDRASAMELAKFILPLCFIQNPLLKVPRLDMKQVVDDIFEVIKEVDLDADKQLVQNNARLENFCQTTAIDTRFIKRCFYGLVDLGMQTPTTKYGVANDGLYFLEAIFMFNNYKIRKKSAQSRTVELERIIKLLQDDLITGSQRVESWILLGQAYGYIVEDDLIWTSDKLNIIERKVLTANIQRKSLLSYLFAINLLTNKGLTEAEHYKPVISVLMNSFVKELYAACKAPLDMIAFKVQNNGKLVRKDSGSTLQTVSEKPTVSMNFCLKLMQQCLHLAIKSNKKEWTSFYYLAKVQAKLKKPPTEILNTTLKASELSVVQGHPSDPLLESTYKLCLWVYKFIKQDKMDIFTGFKFLQKDAVLRRNESVPQTKREMYQVIINCLKKLTSMDKKGWYHKPNYRQAIIYYDEFDDFHLAKSIMAKFFTLRSNNKTFLQMWKPEHERPGKHFVYMYQYTQLYIKLLRRELDLSSLILMLPKLRRANSTMVMLYFAWENICSSICKLIRVVARIEDGFTEAFIQYKPHSTFVGQAKVVVDEVKNTGITPETQTYVAFLHVLNDMRKLNNGFGPTSLIDDTLCSIFVKLFLYETTKMALPEEVPDESPNGKAKKLARRDLFPFITELVNRMKRDVDSLLKDSPLLFNDYVEKYVEERKSDYTRLMTLHHQGPPPMAQPTGLLPSVFESSNLQTLQSLQRSERDEPKSSQEMTQVPENNPVSFATASPARAQARGVPKKGPVDLEIETSFFVKTRRALSFATEPSQEEGKQEPVNEKDGLEHKDELEKELQKDDFQRDREPQKEDPPADATEKGFVLLRSGEVLQSQEAAEATLEQPVEESQAETSNNNEESEDPTATGMKRPNEDDENEAKRAKVD